MRKIIENNHVKVVVANNGKWYTQHKDATLLFLPELVQLVEHDTYKNLTKSGKLFYSNETYEHIDYVKRKELVVDLLYGMDYKLSKEAVSCAGWLNVVEVKVGTTFIIETAFEYINDDYSEYVLELDNYEVFTA